MSLPKRRIRIGSTAWRKALIRRSSKRPTKSQLQRRKNWMARNMRVHHVGFDAWMESCTAK